jgi:hypothetical protein
MKTISKWLSALTALTALSAANAGDATYVFSTISYPDSTITWVYGINNDGQITGTYATSITGGEYVGFTMESNGTFTSLAPNLTPIGINKSGRIAGTSSIGGAPYSDGFIRDVGGDITSFSVPNGIYTEGYGINNKGLVVGQYTPGTDPQGNAAGYLRQTDGSFTTISYPGAINTQAFGINSAGVIVGAYNPGSRSSAFIREPGGDFKSVSFPGATETILFAVNISGMAVGWYYIDSTAEPQGLIREKGKLTTLNFPGALLTYLYGVNDKGQISGSYSSSAGVFGFVATPVDAALATLQSEIEDIATSNKLGIDVRPARTNYEAQDVQATCADLYGFVSELQVLGEMTINPKPHARQMAEARAIEAALGCAQ